MLFSSRTFNSLINLMIVFVVLIKIPPLKHILVTVSMRAGIYGMGTPAWHVWIIVEVDNSHGDLWVPASKDLILQLNLTNGNRGYFNVAIRLCVFFLFDLIYF